MKGNQGLEALAALCGGQSDAPTEDSGLAKGGANAAVESSNKSTSTVTSSGDQSQVPQSPSGPKGVHQVQRQIPQANQQSTAHTILPQQWQKAMGMQGNAMAQNLLMQAGVTQQQATGETAALAAMQQLAYYQYIQAQAKFAAQHAAQMAGCGNGGVFFVDQSQQAALAMAINGKAPTRPGGEGQTAQPQQTQVIPTATVQAPSVAPSNTGSSTNVGSPATSTMKPPPPPSQTLPSLSSTLSTAGIQGTSHAAIAPLPTTSKMMPISDSSSSLTHNTDDKKQQKRAANRRSAQLSRRRKKQFIEELKEENDELRRKEQILRSIPDLIVVFDSSGKLWFVSESVTRFLDMTPEELEGTSFWDRLCEGSVRLLKAAFMDSLAARKSNSDTLPLGSGVWELTLVDKDSSHKAITLNGVVHFSGDAPECVCCIRPREEASVVKLPFEAKASNSVKNRVVSSSDGSQGSRSSVETRRASESPKATHTRVHNNESPAHESRVVGKAGLTQQAIEARNTRGDAFRISDGDTGSVVSSSGSDDGIASN